MKVLFLSNFYPPFGTGGYEQWCQEVAQGLRDRGHEVLVLTNRVGRDSPGRTESTWVLRDLHLEMEPVPLLNGIRFFLRRKLLERENLNHLQLLVTRFSPDIVLIWGMWNLHRSIAALAEKVLPERVVYYIGDYWPTLPSQHELYWKGAARNWITAAPKCLLRPIALRRLARQEHTSLRLENALFPSVFLRDELQRRGVSLKNTRIVYGAVDTDLYRNDRGNLENARPISLLYAGRLVSEKGVHTAIEALAHVISKNGIKSISLKIVGEGESGYEASLRELVRRKGMSRFVTFQGGQAKEAMPSIYRDADILLFTSTWEEPFGRVLVEAMASGLAVIGTNRGGAAEILVDNENALLYPAGDAQTLANQIVRLAESPALRRRLAEEGRKRALSKFDIQRMTTQIESHLESIVHRSESSRSKNPAVDVH